MHRIELLGLNRYHFNKQLYKKGMVYVVNDQLAHVLLNATTHYSDIPLFRQVHGQQVAKPTPPPPPPPKIPEDIVVPNAPLPEAATNVPDEISDNIQETPPDKDAPQDVVVPNEKTEPSKPALTPKQVAAVKQQQKQQQVKKQQQQIANRQKQAKKNAVDV